MKEDENKKDLTPKEMDKVSGGNAEPMFVKLAYGGPSFPKTPSILMRSKSDPTKFTLDPTKLPTNPIKPAEETNEDKKGE